MKVLTGDFNMSLFCVVPELRARELQVEVICANGCRHIVVIDLPYPPRKVSRFLKRLRQGHGLRDFIAKMAIQIVNLDLIWSQSCHDGGTRWIAQRQLIVRSLKTDPGGRKPINVG